MKPGKFYSLDSTAGLLAGFLVLQEIRSVRLDR